MVRVPFKKSLLFCFRELLAIDAGCPELNWVSKYDMKDTFQVRSGPETHQALFTIPQDVQ